MATEIDDCVAYMLKNVSGLYSDQIKINEKKGIKPLLHNNTTNIIYI